MISFMTVDLPDPFGPISPRISPGATVNDMPATAVSPPNRFTSPATSSVTSGNASARRAAPPARTG